MEEMKNYTAFKDRMLKRPAVGRVVENEGGHSGRLKIKYSSYETSDPGLGVKKQSDVAPNSRLPRG